MNTSLTGRVEGSGSSGLPNSIYLRVCGPLLPSPRAQLYGASDSCKGLGGS